MLHSFYKKKNFETLHKLLFTVSLSIREQNSVKYFM